MKRPILTFVVCIFQLILFSQELEERKGFIGISIGPSITTGDYSSKNISNVYAGFADNGLNVNLNLAYRFNNNIGLTAMWSQNYHGMDVNAAVNQFQRIDPTLSWSMQADNWSCGFGLGGLLVSFPFNKLDFDLKAMVGFATCVAPELRLFATDGVESVNVFQQNARGIAPAFGVGMDSDLIFHPALLFSPAWM